MGTSKIVFGIAMAMLASGVGASDSNHGAFTYSRSQDAFSDEDRSFVYTASTSADRRSGVLAWKCMDDGLNVIYMFDSYMGGDSDDEVRVRYRIDAKAPNGPAFWSLLQENKSAYMPMDEVSRFTSAAKAGKKVVFEVVDPLDGERLNDSFSLAGLGSAISRLPCAR